MEIEVRVNELVPPKESWRKRDPNTPPALIDMEDDEKVEILVVTVPAFDTFPVFH